MPIAQRLATLGPRKMKCQLQAAGLADLAPAILGNPDSNRLLRALAARRPFPTTNCPFCYRRACLCAAKVRH